jgi:hypothetical protein
VVVANLSNRHGHGVVVCLHVALTSGSRQGCQSVAPGAHKAVDVRVRTAGVRATAVSLKVTAGRRGAHVRLDQVELHVSAEPATSCSLAHERAPVGPPEPWSGCNDNQAPADTSYVPSPLELPSRRPFLSLDDYTAAPSSDPVAVRFKQYVDRALAGHPDYNYSPADAVVMFARSGRHKYLTSAIADVDREVHRAERAIERGQAPPIADDSYLDVGPLLEDLALTYDWGFPDLTKAQRARWRAYADQAVANVWSPRTATWGRSTAGRYGWSGWSINNPGNNYNFSFIQATQLWALASRERPWMAFLQHDKFPAMSDYYFQLTGGGSREGTGYGTAQRRLWANERTWAEGTGEHLTAIESHASASVDYWIHATVPTLDVFAPIGDLSRESFPHLYDYQENLVREAAMAATGTPVADRAWWWISNNSVPDTMTATFNLRAALLRPQGTADGPTPPTALSHVADGVGQVFARTSWAPDATWLAMIAGPYDESHAHMEQGAFTLYGAGTNAFLAVTANVWSHSGLQGNNDDAGDLGTGASNILRFDTADGPVPQNHGTSTMDVRSPTAGSTTVHADLTPAYGDSSGLVGSWTRDLALSDRHLVVDDHCSVGAGVTPVWQLQVPEEPTFDGPGEVSAGHLHLSFDPAYHVTAVDLHTVTEDLPTSTAWRIELRNPDDCSFHVDLTIP